MEQLQISPATARRMPPPFRLGTAAAATPPRPTLSQREPTASHVSAGDMPTIVQSILDCIQIGAMGGIERHELRREIRSEIRRESG